MNEVHLPTIGGDLRVVGISSQDLLISNRYRALVTQVAVGIPTAVVLEDTLILGSAPVYSRTQAGDYKMTLIGAFPVGRTSVLIGSPDFGADAVIKAVYGASFFGAADDLYFSSIDLEGVNNPGVDGEFTDVLIDICVQIADADSAEDNFNSILNKLDVNQNLLWRKIVVRANSIVTEIDGILFRKVGGTFANSSKVIKS